MTRTSRYRSFARNPLAILAIGTVVLGLTICVCVVPPRTSAARPPDAPVVPPVKIGSYDSRAVAIAFARSEQFQQSIKELRDKHAKAKSDGDEKLAKELSDRGEGLQIRLHLQGFSTAPVDDVLDSVRDDLPNLAARAGVAAIARSADFHDASVDLVDVTDQLVKLFKPNDQTLRIIEECKKQKPLPIEQAAKISADK